MEDRLKKHINLLEQLEEVYFKLIMLKSSKSLIKKCLYYKYRIEYKKIINLLKLNIKYQNIPEYNLESEEYFIRKAKASTKIIKKLLHNGTRKYEEQLESINEENFTNLKFLSKIKKKLYFFIKIMLPKKLKVYKIDKRSYVHKLAIIKFSEEKQFIRNNVFCYPCEKEVALSVFKYHCEGKKHKNKVNKNEYFLYASKRLSEAKKEILKLIKICKKISRIKEPAKNEPTWLIKQKLLNVSFRCKLCGYNKKGKIEFDKHFTGSEHVSKLKALGLKLTDEIKGITSTEILKSFKDKMSDKDSLIFEEEYEDEEGNVYDKNTYEDLKRNGLI